MDKHVLETLIENGCGPALHHDNAADLAENSNLTRRRFLQLATAASGGLAIGLSITNVSLANETKIERNTEFNPNAFIYLHENGDVVMYCGRCEMGQGISSALTLAMADEMEADWERVTVKQADGDEEKYGKQNTAGSQSVRVMLTPMREAGAAAKEMLIAAAAKVWQVNNESCYAEKHTIVHKPTGKTLGYGELASLAALQKIPNKPVLKNKSEYRYIGKEVARHDVGMVVTGQRKYGVDTKLPGLKYAAIVHCPVFAGKLKSLDKSAALKLKGVVDVVVIDRFKDAFGSLGGVAVVADNSWTAQQAVKLLKIEWDKGPNGSYDTQSYKKMLVENVEKPAEVSLERGDVDKAFEQAETRFSATYTGGHLSHSPMEPNASVAWVKENSCEIWASTQSPADIQNVMAKYLKRKASDITVHVMIAGGAFGRKYKCDYVQEAVACSQAVNAPVQLIWSREEDMQTGYYHSINAQHLEAAIDKNGMITGLLHRAAFPSIPSLWNESLDHAPKSAMRELNNHVFKIPNFRTESGYAPVHTRIGWYRAVNNIFLGFAYGTFVDEIAHKVGRSPIDLLNQLYDASKDKNKQRPVERSKGVLALVVEKSGYGKKLPKGEAIGIAVHFSFQSAVAMAVHVKVVDDNIEVLNVDCAIDCGQVLNLDGAKAQMEGAVVMGMGLALRTEITFREGAVVNSNFHNYQVLRINEMPNVRVHAVDSDHPATGLGEPGVGPFAPALSNAIFAASGKRYRDLPFKPMAV